MTVNIMNYLRENKLSAIEKMEDMRYKPKQAYRPLERGNSKLFKGIFSFSLLPVVTCGRACSGCYDLKSLRYSAVRHKRLYNTYLSMKRPDYLKSEIIKQIQMARSIQFVRIHVGGDFYSSQYLRMWLEIAAWVKKNKPHVKIYTYTKTPYGDILNKHGINCVESTLPCGSPNFDTVDNLKQYIKDNPSYVICPVTLGKDVKCGVSCKLCMNYTKVLFVKH